eukprot:1438221-Prymnesium_polylepis.1
MAEIFYATREVHWCNNKIATKIEVLIIHSSHFNVHRNQPVSQVGGEIESSKSLVLHVHIQRKRRIAHTAKTHLIRDGESATMLRSHPSRPLSSVWPCTRAHASPPMPHRSRCGAVRR